MASGKSTIGRHLAGELGWSFFDTDDEIERAEKTSIASMFDTRGEAEFRRIESLMIGQHVRWIERGRPGGAGAGRRRVCRAGQSRPAAATTASAIWLDCPLEVVKHRVAQASHRPLARDPEKFAALYHARRECYALADLHVAIESDDPDVTVTPSCPTPC